MATRPLPRTRAANATPHAIGPPAPTIEFSPMKRRCGAVTYGDPARPPLMPPARCRISAISSSAVIPLSSAQPCPRYVATTRSSGIERGQRTDGNRFLPGAQMDRPGDFRGITTAELQHPLLEKANGLHASKGVQEERAGRIRMLRSRRLGHRRTYAGVRLRDDDDGPLRTRAETSVRAVACARQVAAGRKAACSDRRSSSPGTRRPAPAARTARSRRESERSS